MPLTLELFGGFHLLDAQRRAVHVPDRRARGLIAYLALAEHAVPRLALAELLGSEGDERDQRTALRQAVYLARKATVHPDLFVSVGDQIELNEALLASDARAFRAAITRGDPESLREAVELYRGPLLAGERSPTGAFEEWLAGSRGELLEQVMRALLALAQRHAAAGEHDRSLTLSRRALTLDPLQEDARRQVMRSLAAMGQRAAALREYEIGRQLLADELQVSPDDETEMLRSAIARGEKTLASGPSAPTTPHLFALAGGGSPPDGADRDAPSSAGKRIDVRCLGAPRWSAAAIAAILALVVAGLGTSRYSAQDQPLATAGTSPAGAAVAEAELPLPDKPSIAVLRFENLSGDAEQERLADGVTEDIVTALARFRDLFVISSHSSFRYRNQAVDIKQVGRELGVRFIVEGSVRRAENRLRVTAQLVDATTDEHLWAETYDRELTAANVFKVQDAITARVVAAVGGFHGKVYTSVADSAQRKNTDSLEAYELYCLATHLKQIEYTEQAHKQMAAYYHGAIEKDPNFALAYMGLGWVELRGYWGGWSPNPEASLQEALEYGQKALALDDSQSDIYLLLGDVYISMGQLDRGLAAHARARALNPNDADIKSESGGYLSYASQVDEAVKLVTDAMRLNPFYPDWYLWNAAMAYYEARDYGAVIDAVRRMREPPVDPLLFLAASYARLGRPAEATATVQRVLALDPDATVAKWAAQQPYKNPDDLEHYKDGLRKAGLPEGALTK